MQQKLISRVAHYAKTAALVGAAVSLTVAFSVFATSVGTSISTDGDLSTTGNSTLGSAVSDTLTVNATSTFATGVTISTGGLSILAGGLTVANNATITTGLGVGVSTSTAGVIQTSGIVNVGGAGTSTFANGINLTTGCLTFRGGACLGASASAGGSDTQIQYSSSGILDGVSGFTYNGTTLTMTPLFLVYNSSSTINNLSMVKSTSTSATTTHLAVSGPASFTASTTLTTFGSTGDSYLGDTSADKLTVNATSTFQAGALFSGGVAITGAGGLTVANNATITTGLGVGVATSTAGALQTSGAVQFGGIVSVSQSGTSTISINSTTASRGACLEFESAAGDATFRLYATSSGVAIFESGPCR